MEFNLNGHNPETENGKSEFEINSNTSPIKQRKFTLPPDDGKNYDFTAERKIEKPTNVFESIGHLVKGCLGAGVLGIHEAFMKCGLWTSLAMAIVLGIYVAYCVHTLVRSAQIMYNRLRVTELSYPDLAEVSLQYGPFPKLRKYSSWFRYAVDITICVDLFGACCVYQIIIAKTVQQLIGDYVMENASLNLDLRFYILVLFVPILLLCMIRSLKYLAPFTLLADAFIIICAIATVYYSQRVAPPISERPAWKGWLGFFEFAGVVVFSMEGVGVSLPIENNMKDPKKYNVVLSAGMSIVIFFVVLVGFFGYWGYGENSQSPITLNLPDETFPLVLKCMMAIMILVTFSLNFWPPFNLVWHYMSRRYNPKTFWLWERLYRAFCIIVITIVAVAFPNIGNLMGLLGAFCLSIMGFIFPSIIELLVCWKEPGLGPYNGLLWKNCFIIIIGIVMLVLGSYTNLKGLIADIM